jgi:hypothetical protein
MLSDNLWYFGHIFSALSIMFTRDNYPIAVSLAIFGQSITIISRPIGRLTNIHVMPDIENNIQNNNDKIT